MNDKLVTAARVLMGLLYVVNGLNWWFKVITPYPSISDFADMAPPPDIVGAMIGNGMFHMVKALELLTGIALLANMFVPLMLVAVLPVTISVFLVDVFFIATLRGFTMGAGSLLLNLFLLTAYLGHYRTMLTLRGRPLSRDTAAIDAQAGLGDALHRLTAPLFGLFGLVTIAIGTVMLVWVLVMIGQYIANPLPLSAVIPHRN